MLISWELRQHYPIGEVYYLSEMTDWLDDLYDSPSSNDISIIDRKDEIVDSVIDEFNVQNKSMVRLRWVINEKMKIRGHIYSSELLEIYYTMLETDDYDGRLIKHKGVSDIIIRRKSWRERHRYIESAIITAISIIIGYVLAAVKIR